MMRCALISILLALCACPLVLGEGIAYREWANRADYTSNKEPLYIGVFEPVMKTP